MLMMYNQDILDYIDNGVDRNILVYDSDSAYGNISKKLLCSMVEVSRENKIETNTFIIDNNNSTDIMCMYDVELLNDMYRESNDPEFHFAGNKIRFIHGLSKQYYWQSAEYIKYFKEHLGGLLPYNHVSIILMVGDGDECLLGSY